MKSLWSGRLGPRVRSFVNQPINPPLSTVWLQVMLECYSSFQFSWCPSGLFTCRMLLPVVFGFASLSRLPGSLSLPFLITPVFPQFLVVPRLHSVMCFPAGAPWPPGQTGLPAVQWTPTTKPPCCLKFKKINYPTDLLWMLNDHWWAQELV